MIGNSNAAALQSIACSDTPRRRGCLAATRLCSTHSIHQVPGPYSTQDTHAVCANITTRKATLVHRQSHTIGTHSSTTHIHSQRVETCGDMMLWLSALDVHTYTHKATVYIHTPRCRGGTLACRTAPRTLLGVHAVHTQQARRWQLAASGCGQIGGCSDGGLTKRWQMKCCERKCANARRPGMPEKLHTH